MKYRIKTIIITCKICFILYELCTDRDAARRKFYKTANFLSRDFFSHPAVRAPSEPGPWGFSLTSLMDDPAMFVAIRDLRNFREVFGVQWPWRLTFDVLNLNLVHGLLLLWGTFIQLFLKFFCALLLSSSETARDRRTDGRTDGREIRAMRPMQDDCIHILTTCWPYIDL